MMMLRVKHIGAMNVIIRELWMSEQQKEFLESLPDDLRGYDYEDLLNVADELLAIAKSQLERVE